MNSNVVSIFKNGRAPRVGFNPSWQAESAHTDRAGQTPDVEADSQMTDLTGLTGLTEEEWDAVFGGSFIIY